MRLRATGSKKELLKDRKIVQFLSTSGLTTSRTKHWIWHF